MARVGTPARRAAVVVAVVLVALVLGAAIGAATAVLRGPSWTSEAQLLWDPSVRASFDPTYNQPDSQTFDRQVADQQDVVLSDDVVGRVAQAVDQPADELRDRIAVTSTAGSGAFTIAATEPTAVQARSVARATTTAYIAVLRQRNEQFLQARVDALTTQVAALRRQASAANASTQNALATSLADLQSQQTAASAQLSDVPVEASVQRAAATPLSPSSLSVPVQAIVGGGLAALLAICALLLLNARRQGTADRAGRPVAPATPTTLPPVPGQRVAPAPQVETMPSPGPAASSAAAPLLPPSTEVSTSASDDASNRSTGGGDAAEEGPRDEAPEPQRDRPVRVE